MIPKSEKRFSDKIMLAMQGMIPKGGDRFSVKILLKDEFSGAARLWG
jgi:hypothetical protein